VRLIGCGALGLVHCGAARRPYPKKIEKSGSGPTNSA
jgi:hypothetical protein